MALKLSSIGTWEEELYWVRQDGDLTKFYHLGGEGGLTYEQYHGLLGGDRSLLPDKADVVLQREVVGSNPSRRVSELNISAPAVIAVGGITAGAILLSLIL